MLANLGFTPKVSIVSRDNCNRIIEDDCIDDNNDDDYNDNDADPEISDADLEDTVQDITSPFQYLLHTTHYDPDDSGVFRCDKIELYTYKDGAEIVVYRSKFDENTHQWSQTNTDDPITAISVAKLSKVAKNVKMMRGILGVVQYYYIMQMIV